MFLRTSSAFMVPAKDRFHHGLRAFEESGRNTRSVG
jgi:hypothetical protein